MRLEFENFDGRKEGQYDVIDVVTGKIVGQIDVGGTGFDRSGGMSIRLFGGKYRGVFNNYGECLAFVKGAQAVLDHMTNTLPPR